MTTLIVLVCILLFPLLLYRKQVSAHGSQDCPRNGRTNQIIEILSLGRRYYRRFFAHHKQMAIRVNITSLCSLA